MSEEIKNPERSLNLFHPTPSLRWHYNKNTESNTLQQLWINCNTQEEQWRNVPTE